jgi:TPR repeat protein
LKLLFAYLRLLLISGVLSLIVFTDVCQSPQRLVQQASDLNDKEQALLLLYPAVLAGSGDAQTLFTQIAIQIDDQYWLRVAGELGSSGALYYNAMQSKDAKSIRRWLKKSAELGHPQSQFEYALLQRKFADKIKWMTQSAEQGYEPAIISMAKYTFEANNDDEAMRWLSKAAEFDASSAHKVANLYWKKGQKEQAQSFFQTAAEQGYDASITMLDILERYSPQALTSLQDVPPESAECAQSVQFVANSLVSFAQALSFKAEYEKDARLASLPICLAEPIWLQKNALNCQANFNGQPRLGCDLYPLSKMKTPFGFTHMVVFAEQGKANVNNGVMYLDQSDTYAVFVHELAHFAGFVDEYALPPELANYHCNKNQAPNLLLGKEVVIESREDESNGADTADTMEENDEASVEQASVEKESVTRLVYEPEQRFATWATALEAHNNLQLLESNNPILHRISPSNTCKNTDVKSYKPSHQMTFLEYHDLRNIPRVYRTLWRQVLVNTADYSAINDNLAIAAFENGDNDAGVFWTDLSR